MNLRMRRIPAILAFMKRLGIIGGMGPAATARLFTRVVELTDAACDQEHLDIRITNNPHVPDRTAFLLGKPGSQNFVPVLQREALELEQMGCEVLAVPCNTSHARFEEISVPLDKATLLNMVGETAARARQLGCTSVGILATSGTIACNVYQRALASSGLEAIVPGEQVQQQVMSAIYDYVKAGKPIPDGHLERVFDALIAQGCDGLLLGCTELTFAGTSWRGVPVIDALDVLARRCVQACGAPLKATDN